MSDFTPTPEQVAIIDAARDTQDNLLISALAGAAKTSTLVLIAEALPKTSILCLAFNKKIAEEMKTRLPGNCTAMTLNSLGHRTWANYIGVRLKLDMSKTHRLLTHVFEHDLRANEKEQLYPDFAELMKGVSALKSNGYIPDDYVRKGHKARPVMGDAEFENVFDEELSDLAANVIRVVYRRGLDEAFEGIIDFDDQIIMPTVYPAYFDSYPLVLVDEAQDLSPLNHATLRKLVKKRIIAVGDDCQAIYGFRGADNASMEKLRQSFSMTQLGLSISFRCPKAVVREARWRAPHMQWPEWAREGEVRRAEGWGPADVPDFAAVICRNNAPLFSMAIRFLKNGRFPELIGNDIGKYLLKVMRGFGPLQMSAAEAEGKLQEWADKKKKKAKNPARIDDQVECIQVFLDQGTTLGEGVAYAEHIMSAAGPIKLMTGHKSKGLEFDHVFFLDEFLVGKEGQDPNLRYVIQTRSKSTLTYIDSRLFQENEE